MKSYYKFNNEFGNLLTDKFAENILRKINLKWKIEVIMT